MKILLFLVCASIASAQLVSRSADPPKTPVAATPAPAPAPAPTFTSEERETLFQKSTDALSAQLQLQSTPEGKALQAAQMAVESAQKALDATTAAATVKKANEEYQKQLGLMTDRCSKAGLVLQGDAQRKPVCAADPNKKP